MVLKVYSTRALTYESRIRYNSIFNSCCPFISRWGICGSRSQQPAFGAANHYQICCLCTVDEYVYLRSHQDTTCPLRSGSLTYVPYFWAHSLPFQKSRYC
ncbi:hypothetical protein K443DRAFT_295981 [Laccaria amethystina LaAM-08-1]|uniref:Uncharacterized protein n=1 Tax=Laccaria amethystina LaAM-08-1 TaxID=1095629 RepID=A0A0C9XEH0_9AGAR|nr:hypothetical protein K443DRAFT_295981 [Laccaria amethystina LaAM-08-1]